MCIVLLLPPLLCAVSATVLYTNRIGSLQDTLYIFNGLAIAGNSYEIWAEKVVQPATEIVRSFLSQGACPATIRGEVNDIGAKIVERDLWTQYICKVSNACRLMEVALRTHNL